MLRTGRSLNGLALRRSAGVSHIAFPQVEILRLALARISAQAVRGNPSAQPGTLLTCADVLPPPSSLAVSLLRLGC